MRGDVSAGYISHTFRHKMRINLIAWISIRRLLLLRLEYIFRELILSQVFFISECSYWIFISWLSHCTIICLLTNYLNMHNIYAFKSNDRFIITVVYYMYPLYYMYSSLKEWFFIRQSQSSYFHELDVNTFLLIKHLFYELYIIHTATSNCLGVSRPSSFFLLVTDGT